MLHVVLGEFSFTLIKALSVLIRKCISKPFIKAAKYFKYLGTMKLLVCLVFFKGKTNELCCHHSSTHNFKDVLIVFVQYLGVETISVYKIALRSMS